MTERVSPELEARMIALVRDISDVHPESVLGDSTYADRARKLAAQLSPPVDPDVLVVRQVLHAQQRAMTPPDSGWGNMSFAKGSYDHLPEFQAALAAYRLAARDPHHDR